MISAISICILNPPRQLLAEFGAQATSVSLASRHARTRLFKRNRQNCFTCLGSEFTFALDIEK